MIPILVVGGVVVIVLVGAIAYEAVVWRRLWRDPSPPVPIDTDQQRRALRSIAAADYARFVRQKRNGRG